ncbi:MAG: aconitate hydratase AcnA [Rhodospirillaceae bacterium]|nr:aconitate hydratase AcnA [Rhodospirillaceae bacterium]MBT4114949.1 aconitate hydratase AcnA [Rhodospirillaceae bacterium]MBT4719702.1 aconitate hydratase AcnA [Rhodospirillaceae bacterium]MBT5841896.1 aconitate hydratase AcnA [Rhodospirillaceae bacterium]MBT6859267.1 aconitate hydratase AcnA [Rhodospirillaceae bacterium]
MAEVGQDSLKTRATLSAGGKNYDYYSLDAASKGGLGDLSRLPFSLKVLLENLLRYEDGVSVTTDDIKALAERRPNHEIAFRPGRVLLQDFTGVPAVVDLAAMREAMSDLGGDPRKINPQSPVDLVIDHSVMIDNFGSSTAFDANVEMEFERNQERYEFLRWGSEAFDNFRVVPPGTGICHQVNLEFLAQTVWTADVEGAEVAYPDTVVGTDSHTTMINGLAVLGWGVGGIEAEAAMLGQPVSMLIPEVIGFKLTGEMREGNTATDLVLTVVQMLRAKGVVGKFVEFYGPALDSLSLPDRATLANMAPEYGATCGFFPVDKETIRFLKFTSRDAGRVALVEAYAKAQGMWRDTSTPDPEFTDTLELDISTVEPSISGPKRPQDRIPLSGAAPAFAKTLDDVGKGSGPIEAAGADYTVQDGDVVIAAITSCTNTSNPSVLLAAGLLARNAAAKGLRPKPWVKTSLAPGSQVVTDYLTDAGVLVDLETLGFNVVGYGCTTCIGNSGPLPEPVARAIDAGDLTVCSVLSGNRNFEGRIHAQIKTNYLASPPLVVAYAIAGSMTRDLYNDPLGKNSDGELVYLKDIWPTNEEIQNAVASHITPEMFAQRYGDEVWAGPQQWQDIKSAGELTYGWQEHSTYVKYPSFFDGMTQEAGDFADVEGARELAILGDSVTTDHISPAGAIQESGPAGIYLTERQVRPAEFNSYGSRRGNHEVMMRGTFANIRIRNEMAPGTEGGVTVHQPSGEQMPIYDAAMKYAAEDTPLVIIGGKEYGNGSSRDWAAKGTRLLGVQAVIVESFERIHRSNLVGMGILPLQFKDGTTRKTLGLDGTEVFDITGIKDGIDPRMDVACRITRADGSSEDIALLCRIDTADEVEYYRHGGILQYVLRRLKAA